MDEDDDEEDAEEEEDVHGLKSPKAVKVSTVSPLLSFTYLCYFPQISFFPFLLMDFIWPEVDRQAFVL